MFPGIGFQELMVIGIVAVILFGRKLPEVAKSVGKSYFEFKKGLFDVQKSFDPRNFIDSTSSSKPSTRSYQEDYDDREEATAPRFEPPPAED